MPNKIYTFREFDIKYVEPIKDLIADIVYPDKRYLGYRNTPIIRLKDGRSIPLLHFLAKLKHGPSYDMALQEAVWSDTNWYNATPDNITLLDLARKEVKRAGRPSKLNLGVPYGHPDYQRRYLEVTRDKQREYRRKRYVAKRYGAIEAADQASIVQEPPPEQLDTTTAMSDRLDDILASTKVRSTPISQLPTPNVRWSSIAASPIPSSFSKEFLDGLAAAPISGREDK